MYVFFVLLTQIQASTPFTQGGFSRNQFLRKNEINKSHHCDHHDHQNQLKRYTLSALTRLRSGANEVEDFSDSSMDILPSSLRELVEDTISSQRKIIVVTGGVLSGIGKGVTASSIGVLLRAMGLRVTALKIDPYLNVDAGTMSPFEHGEVFVLDDGGETDLDLGNYERFLSVSLTKESNLSTGKIYQVGFDLCMFSLKRKNALKIVLSTASCKQNYFFF